MADQFTRAFWVSVVVAIPSALVLDGPLRWIPITWLGAIGAVFAIVNWACVVAYLSKGQAPSMVPLVGGLLLFIAAASFPFPVAQRWAPLAFAVDPWVGATLIGLLVSLRSKRIAGGSGPRT